MWICYYRIFIFDFIKPIGNESLLAQVTSELTDSLILESQVVHGDP